MTKPTELRSLSELDRAQRLIDARKELFNLRFQLATGRLDNVSRIAIVRKDIARLLTIAAEDAAAVERSAKRTRKSRG
ncbi:MAG TPA: 50S ribosomal protein L29 [Acidimicrobiales bacterium]|nr:50S ribosomal protein L29 [Acidimicrobiales bacterium]